MNKACCSAAARGGDLLDGLPRVRSCRVRNVESNMCTIER
jgi:hypothetical protein